MDSERVVSLSELTKLFTNKHTHTHTNVVSRRKTKIHQDAKLQIVYVLIIQFSGDLNEDKK